MTEGGWIATSQAPRDDGQMSLRAKRGNPVSAQAPETTKEPKGSFVSSHDGLLADFKYLQNS
jgi:hypothetical protein